MAELVSPDTGNGFTAIPGFLCPTISRTVLAVVVASICCTLPQTPSLEFFPVRTATDEQLFVEMTCRADRHGTIQIYYDNMRGINEVDTISWLIGPGEHFFTYTFPLPDQPIREMRLDSVERGGTLWISSLRLTNRKRETLLQITPSMLQPIQQIQAVRAAGDTWSITSDLEANDPFGNIAMPHTIAPSQYWKRNLTRSVTSIAYLTAMLTVALFAIIFAIAPGRPFQSYVPALCFAVFVAFLFSAAAHRGMIRDTLRTWPNESVVSVSGITRDTPFVI